MKKQNTIFLMAFLMVSLVTNAQKDSMWHLNPSTAEEAGIDWEKANEFVKGKKATTILVAVIDDGVDVEHPDLSKNIWTNSDEVVGNNKDDDGNGFVDDVYGWNFIGKTKEDNLEKARYVSMLEKKYAEMSKSEKAEDPEYANYLVVSTSFAEEVKAMEKQVKRVDKMAKYLKKVKRKHGDAPTLKDIKRTMAFGMTQRLVKGGVKRGLEKNPQAFSRILGSIEGAQGAMASRLNYHYNKNLDQRTSNVGDNYSNVNEKVYGDNEVNYFSSGHGTHVAGIIAADGSNDFGAQGVCTTCEIMSVRAVPDGDERDKDVANSIIYAVDNGAKVINMSFGKGISPNADVVKAAIKYAEENNVLLVHAAGNNSSNNDEVGNYPNDKEVSGSNWLEVGASSFRSSPKRLADFSNYGVKGVDLFAPGHMIYSTWTEKGYISISGTSMASPVAAGVAAYVWSYYPSLTAAQVKEVLMKSVVTIDDAQQIPGSEDLAKVSELCVTGGVVNLYNALVLANKMVSGN
mgnify:FL=1